MAEVSAMRRSRRQASVPGQPGPIGTGAAGRKRRVMPACLIALPPQVRAKLDQRCVGVISALYSSRIQGGARGADPPEPGDSGASVGREARRAHPDAGPRGPFLGADRSASPPRARARLCSRVPRQVEVASSSHSHRRVEEVWGPDQLVLVCPGVSSGPEVPQTSSNPEPGRPGPGQSGSQEPQSDASRRFGALLARIRAKQKASREQQAPPPLG